MNQGNGQNDNRVLSFLEQLKSRQIETGAQESNRPFGGVETFTEKKRREEAGRAEYQANRRKEEVEVYSSSKSDEERMKHEIHQRLEIISKKVEKKAPALRKEIIKQLVKPGRSDMTIMDHWQSLVEFLYSKVENSGNWLARFNARCKKQGVYRDMEKKGGTKYTQSLDISVARSVG